MKEEENQKLPKFPKFERYSQLISNENEDGIENENEKIRESILAKKTDDENNTVVSTLYHLLERTVQNYGSNNFVGEQIATENGQIEYRWTTYAQVMQDAKFVGSALCKLGIASGQQSRIGIAGLNSPRYVTATFALVSFSMVAVPLYHNYKLDDIVQIINRCELEAIFCDSFERAQKFVANLAKLPTLRVLVVMNGGDAKQIAKLSTDAEIHKIQIFNWESFVKMGEANVLNAVAPSPEHIYVICHTSGTTGTPKGVQLSHRALLAASVGGLHVQWCRPPHNFRVDSRDVYLSFLSPAHSYEQLMQTFLIYVGGKIGTFGGNAQRLIADMQILRPTIVALVPRLLEKFRAKIMSDLRNANPICKMLFEFAVKAKIRMLKNGNLRYNTVWDQIIFRKHVHRNFGGRLRLITTGGAPITASTMLFSRAVYGCPVFEGYGQTECCAAGTLSLPADTTCNHVGGPSPWAQIKLVDIPELGYFAAENRGEVCFRGAALMSGYFREDRLTAETIDETGWLHTGDVGEWLANDSLRIIDRKRNFFKLSQGDFVAPEQIENIYCQHPNVLQIFVTGRSKESFLVAIVVCNNIEINQLGKCGESAKKPLLSDESSTIGNSSTSEYNHEKIIRTKLLNDLRDFGSSKGLTGIEQIRNLQVTNEEFSMDQELLTPTLKLRRSKLNEYFAKTIESLYAEGALA